MDTSAPLPSLTRDLDATLSATTRYRQALTGLDEPSARQPSDLPGWSRAFVVAHLARNADAFTRVLTEASQDRPASMYDSPEDRDRAIEETVSDHDLAGLLADTADSCSRLEQAWADCRADPATPYTRVPGGAEVFPLSTVGPRRRAEVEIHHSDLGLGYLPVQWPTGFSRRLVTQRADELAALPGGALSIVLTATDVDGVWTIGPDPGLEVSGAVGDLAWWLVGRGGGRGLTCSPGPLPVLGRWR